MSEDLFKNDPLKNTNMYADGPLPTPQDGGNDWQNPYYLAGHRPIEIILQQALQYTLQNIRQMAADPANTLFDRVFGFFPKEDKAAIREYLATTNIADHVYRNFPKYEYDLPLVAVHSREEGESRVQHQTFHHEALVVNLPDGTSSELVGQQIGGACDIIIITDDPATTMMLYRVVWYLIFSNKFDLEQHQDIHDLAMDGGALNFDAQTFPNWQYSRVIMLKYQTAFDYYLEDMRAPKALSFFATPTAPSSSGG